MGGEGGGREGGRGEGGGGGGGEGEGGREEGDGRRRRMLGERDRRGREGGGRWREKETGEEGISSGNKIGTEMIFDHYNHCSSLPPSLLLPCLTE